MKQETGEDLTQKNNFNGWGEQLKKKLVGKSLKETEKALK